MVRKTGLLMSVPKQTQVTTEYAQPYFSSGDEAI
jgi:hypothetical protein